LPVCFPHERGRKEGEPVQDLKNAFHTALEIAKIKDFTWHDLRHHADSRIMPSTHSAGAVSSAPDDALSLVRSA
jgi:hypothetical protein